MLLTVFKEFSVLAWFRIVGSGTIDRAVSGGKGYKGDNRAEIPARMLFFNTASPRRLGSYSPS
jgi:hypothetical protein